MRISLFNPDCRLYADQKKAYAIVKRPLVQSALTEALGSRQGVTFDHILQPVVDALDARVIARTVLGPSKRIYRTIGCGLRRMTA